MQNQLFPRGINCNWNHRITKPDGKNEENFSTWNKNTKNNTSEQTTTKFNINFGDRLSGLAKTKDLLNTCVKRFKKSMHALEAHSMDEILNEWHFNKSEYT